MFYFASRAMQMFYFSPRRQGPRQALLDLPHRHGSRGGPARCRAHPAPGLRLASMAVRLVRGAGFPSCPPVAFLPTRPTAAARRGEGPPFGRSPGCGGHGHAGDGCRRGCGGAAAAAAGFRAAAGPPPHPALLCTRRLHCSKRVGL